MDIKVVWKWVSALQYRGCGVVWIFYVAIYLKYFQIGVAGGHDYKMSVVAKLQRIKLKAIRESTQCIYHPWLGWGGGVINITLLVIKFTRASENYPDNLILSWYARWRQQTN